MFEAARELVLKDRTKAKKALAAEMKRHQGEELDAELDQLAEEEHQREELEAAGRAKTKAITEVSSELREVRKRQHDLAVRFDASLAEAGSAFEELEALANRAATLERVAGEGSGERPLVVGHARTGAIIAAVWNAARPLAKRLRLSAVPGRGRNIRPLADLYPNLKDK